MKKIKHFFILSCLKATAIIEKKLHVKLSLKEKIQLHMHKYLCEACTNYDAQSMVIEDKLFKFSPTIDDLDLKDFKKTILEKLPQ